MAQAVANPSNRGRLGCSLCYPIARIHIFRTLSEVNPVIGVEYTFSDQAVG